MGLFDWILRRRRDEDLQAEIRALKERIQVLERIATDTNRAASLDEEIERLRDRSHP